MKIATVVGARPQFIKAAAVSQAMRLVRGLQEDLIHTGQHYDPGLSDVFFSELDIPRPAHSLGVGGGSHGEMTGRMLEKLDALFARERPDLVLVYGDTNSTLAGAVAAIKLHIPVAHVEAGLRSFNRAMPEEVNRVLTDHSSTMLFCPTATSVENLRREGITDGVHLVGDVMYDVALQFGERAERASDVLKRLGLGRKAYILATVHRAENTDDSARLKSVFEAFESLASHIDIVLPLHPRTRKALGAKADRRSARLKIVDPVGFLDMLVLEKNASLVATDSGGVQKEAYFYGVPCVTMRDETEWVELVEIGANTLAPPHSSESLVAALRAGLATQLPPDLPKLYGDGAAARRIVEFIATR